MLKSVCVCPELKQQDLQLVNEYLYRALHDREQKRQRRKPGERGIGPDVNIFALGWVHAILALEQELD